MKARVNGFSGNPGWNNEAAPFGSEFAWDTTGQEETAIWGAHFNASSSWGNLNQRVVETILSYVVGTDTVSLDEAVCSRLMIVANHASMDHAWRCCRVRFAHNHSVCAPEVL